jgi:cysteinyl-tRNA synthetase
MKNFLALSLILIPFLTCTKENDIPSDLNFKQEMRDFVIGISKDAKATKADFLIFPQNGIELVTDDGDENGTINNTYLEAIDGNGQEDLFYGYDSDNQATPANENNYLRTFLDISKNAGNTILVTDYCSTPANMDDSYQQNKNAGYISFAADNRELSSIPGYPQNPYSVNPGIVTNLASVQNFLYLINPELFNSKQAFINAVKATNYDLAIIDLFFHDGTVFTAAEIDQMKNKANGGQRIMLCYMSIGEAEDYRYYWQSNWNNDNPAWLDKENPNWAGNYKVKYWEEDWQSILFGKEESYLAKILDSNFDGVYLDIIDAYEFYE